MCDSDPRIRPAPPPPARPRVAAVGTRCHSRVETRGDHEHPHHRQRRPSPPSTPRPPRAHGDRIRARRVPAP
ncbi:hypothetical protein DZF98_15805, partial [Clavibacter californiensis]